MSSVRFEPTIPAFEQVHASDRAATVIGKRGPLPAVNLPAREADHIHLLLRLRSLVIPSP
jgi:hypothetical protein